MPPAAPTNAIAAAQTAIDMAQTIVSDAQAVWPVVYASLPAAQQASTQDAFNKAIFAANHAILALEDAEQAAVAANVSNPDFTAILSQVSDAVGQVITIVQGLQVSSGAIAPANRPQGGPLADMVEASLKLKVQADKK
jgi:hypothetical protein